ncbi:hypothetical protein D3C86_1609110 [compost metagenome]
MDDRIDAFGQRQYIGQIAKITAHQLLVRRRRAHVSDIGQAQLIGEISQVLAQDLAQAAGSTGDQQSFERLAHQINLELVSDCNA